MRRPVANHKSRHESRQGRELVGGYIASGLIFAGFTGLWAFIVRDDPYYRLTDLFGARVPAMMIAYLVLMPLAGLVIGRWRYDRGAGGLARFGAKLGARALHFTYAHSLIVLFTAAMLAETWLGLNLDDQVKKFDDRMFDLAARFAPWLAAYLAGFNFGRASVVGSLAPSAPGRGQAGAAFVEAPPQTDETPPTPDIPVRKSAAKNAARTEPVLTEGDAPRSARTPRPRQTASGLAVAAEAADHEPGFLPPQDIERLRPAFNRLR